MRWDVERRQEGAAGGVEDWVGESDDLGSGFSWGETKGGRLQLIKLGTVVGASGKYWSQTCFQACNGMLKPFILNLGQTND